MAGYGGYRPGAGRKKGSPNKATIERLEKERVREQVLKELDDARRADSEVAKRRAKETMEECLHMVRDITFYYQPVMAKNGKVKNVEKFKEWLDLLMKIAAMLAPYQSPTFKAVAVTMDQVIPAPPSPPMIENQTGKVIELNKDPVALQAAYERMIRQATGG